MIRDFRAQPHHRIIVPAIFVAWLWIVTSLLLSLVLHIGWLFNKDEVHHEFAFVQLFIFVNFGVFILGLTFGISEISCDQWLEKLMERRAFQLFKAYVLPFFIVSSMCILEEIYVWGAVHRTQLTGGELESGYLLKHLLVTGIIPMRIIFALHPPISRLNIITGGLGLTYFVYEIVILVNELSGW
jgi:hypothetical protein